MKHYLFIDESGDHGLTMVNPDFPVFLLCGVLIANDNYEKTRTDINALKTSIWGNKLVILHSRDIRKCEKEFSKLFDIEIKKDFYNRINTIMSENNYIIIASAIRKDDYIKRFGRLSNDVYELALSFIIERAIFFLDDIKEENKELEIVIERRGTIEDKKLGEHFQRLLSRGTGYVNAARLTDYKLSIVFKDKRENINGLQLADLIAYPVARYVIDPERANPAFEIIEPKIYAKGSKRYGLKVFP